MILKIFYSWLLFLNFFEYSQVMIMLDNYSMHKSKVTKSAFKRYYILRCTFLDIPDVILVELWFRISKEI